MPLNYSKWDALELSDDSDIEEHPNVDKRSFIRMKQRQIHEQRAERKLRIAHLHSEGPMNQTLLGRIDSLLSLARSQGTRGVAKEASLLREKTKDLPPLKPEETPSFDVMVSNLLAQVFSAVKEKNPKEGEEMDKTVIQELEDHRKRLAEREEQRKVELEKDEADAKKHITSEDIHDGFNVSHVDKTPSQSIAPTAPGKSTSKGKSKEIEVLNPRGVASASPPASTSASKPIAAPRDPDSDADSSSSDLPDLTPSALSFSHIKPSDYPSSFRAIQADSSLYTSESTTDALLVEAFNAEMRGEKEYAKGCVHQALLLQYCRKLGKDGVALFFKKVGAGDPRAFGVFIEDVQSTYARISSRCASIKAERASHPSPQEGEETIQLVAQDPSVTINFEVPDGPPPENLSLSGEGVEKLDVEKVKEFLQLRWDTFLSFPKNFQKALKTKKLEEVNRVLGKMRVEEAEEVVKQLDEVGILSFASSDVIDQTGKGKAPQQAEGEGQVEAVEQGSTEAPKVIDLDID